MVFSESSKYRLFSYGILLIALFVFSTRLYATFILEPGLKNQIHLYLSALDTPIHYLMFLGMMLIWKRSIEKHDLMLVLGVAYLFSAFDVLGIVYDFMTQDFQVSNLINYKFTNCQYIKLSVTIFVWMAVIYLQFWKSQRTFSRGFFVILVLSYYLFVYIAHLAVVDLNLNNLQDNIRGDYDKVFAKIHKPEQVKRFCNITNSVCDVVDTSKIGERLAEMQDSRQIGLVKKFDLADLSSKIVNDGYYSISQLDVIFDYQDESKSISHIVIFKKLDDGLHVIMEKRVSSQVQVKFMEAFVVFQYLFILSWFVGFTYLGYRHDKINKLA